MRILLVAILCAIAPQAMLSQDYKNAIGFRGGLNSGITYQHFFDEEIDIKLMLSWRSGGVQFIAMVENYQPIMLTYTDKVFLYYGFGVHAGFASDQEYQYLYPGNFNSDNYFGVIGADGIIGVEYRFITLPIALGFDYKPFFELYRQNLFRFNVNDFALSLKFTF